MRITKILFVGKQKMPWFQPLHKLQNGKLCCYCHDYPCAKFRKKVKICQNGGWNYKRTHLMESKKIETLSTQMQRRMRYWTRKRLFGDMIVLSRPTYLSATAPFQPTEQRIIEYDVTSTVASFLSLPLPHSLRSLSPSQCINFSGLIRGVNLTKSAYLRQSFLRHFHCHHLFN